DDLGGPTDDNSPADDNSTTAGDDSTPDPSVNDDANPADNGSDDAQLTPPDDDGGMPPSASETDGDDDNGNSVSIGDASASAAVICGNGASDVGEECDGADLNGASCESLMPSVFSGGVLRCSDNCEFDTSACESVATCGNGVLEPGEECDSLELSGQSCGGLGYSGGRLSCDADCGLDESDCEVGQDCDAVLNTPLGVVYRGNTEDASSNVNEHSCVSQGGGRGGDLSLAWTAPGSGCY